jgi:hypothetical protein
MPRHPGSLKPATSRLYTFGWESDAEWQAYAQDQVHAVLMRDAWLEIGRVVRDAMVEAKA